MRILLDENIPFALRKLLGGHEVKHTSEEGWDGLSNGELVAVAEGAGYDVISRRTRTCVTSRTWRCARLPSWR